MKYNAVINISYGADPLNNGAAYPEPVLLSDAKTFLRVSNTVEDALISQLIISARLQAEKYTGIYLKPRNIIAMVNCGLGMCEIPGPCFNPISWINPPANNTVTSSNYNSSLNFTTAATLSVQGVTGVSTGAMSFLFNLISPRVGSTYTMPINYNGTLLLTITYPSDYLGQEFQYTDSNGQVFKANFVNGTLDLLYNDFATREGFKLTGGIFKSIVEASDSTERLSYTVGYINCPEDIKQAMLNQIAFMYQNRGDDLKTGSISSMFISSLSMYKRVWI